MLKLGPRHFLAETIEDLPAPRPGLIFKDCETRSRGEEVESLQRAANAPYLGDRACMWAVCFDDEGPAISVPIRMRNSPNLPLEPCLRWSRDVINAATGWVNHNVKFDAHFAAVDGAPFPETCKLIDTLTLSKVINTDRWTHGLKELLRELLNRATESEDRVKAFLNGYNLGRNRKAKDYALVPSDILGYYACDDVLGNRDLFRYLQKQLPEQVGPTWAMEQELTPVLWDMESAGLRTETVELRKAKVISIHKQISMATRLNAITGTEFADSSAYSYALICGKWGLPVLARNKESGNPSFDYEALLLYLSHPEVLADQMKLEAIKLMMALRDEETFSSLFLDVFTEQQDSRGYVHPMYNQLVRTGRMSCEKPNAQQFDKRAKSLVYTDTPTDGFLDIDASQIEFRTIVHYIQDERAIAAYQNDPKTDFHQWVADLCQINRKPAKDINFAQAFGAGKKKIVSMLASNPLIIAAVNAEVDQMIKDGVIKSDDRMKAYADLCWLRGEAVFNTYHSSLPTLKKTSKKAEAIARARGFVFNFFGRRRHLPPKACHVAFNTLCQGTAMDLVKRRMIRTAPRYNPDLKRDGITMRANVHDAILYHGDQEALKKWQPWIMEQLEATEPGFRVPIRWEAEFKTGTWETIKS